MKEKINEVVNYFKSKLLRGEFEITKQEEYYITLLIDNEYVFTIWAGNLHLPNTRKQEGKCASENFIDLNLQVEERVILHNLLADQIEKFRKDYLLTKKTEELEKLKQELNIL